MISRPEILYKRVDVLVTRDETVEKQDLLQTELSVEALMCCLFLFMKRQTTSAAHGRGTQSVLLQKLNCLSALATLQALHFNPLE